MPLKVGFGRGVTPALVSAVFKNCTCATSSFIISLNAALVSARDGIISPAAAVGVFPVVVVVGVCPPFPVVVVCPQAASNTTGATTAVVVIERRMNDLRDECCVSSDDLSENGLPSFSLAALN